MQISLSSVYGILDEKAWLLCKFKTVFNFNSWISYEITLIHLNKIILIDIKERL